MPITDARQKLNKSKFADARSKLNKIHSQETITSNKLNVTDARLKLNSAKAPTKASTKRVADARLRIKAKQGRITKPQPVNQSVKRVQMIINQQITPTVTGTTRTIRNPAAVSKRKLSIPDFSKEKPTGFVSVSNGSRTLVNKVTVKPVGLTVAVRNELVSTSRPSKTRVKPFAKKSAVNKGLKITMSNPDAIKRPRKQQARPQPSFAKKPVRKRPAPPPEVTFNVDTRMATAPVSSASEDTYPSIIPSPPKRHRPDVLTPRPMMSAKTLGVPPPPAVMVTSTDVNKLNRDDSFVDELSSPFEGTKILVSNLHHVVVEEDILELFSVLGPVRRARLIGPGKAEVVFIRRDDAIRAYQKYNNRDLDGQPMRMKLLLQERIPQSSVKYSWMSEIRSLQKKGADVVEIHPDILQRALFKGGSTGTSTRPVVFTVKI